MKVVDPAGRRFDSKLEHAVFQELSLLVKTGKFRDLQQQKTVHITEARIGYRADFSLFDVEANEEILIEAKGMPSDVWNLKLKLYRVYGTQRLWLYTGSHKYPKLSEVITPRDHGKVL